MYLPLKGQWFLKMGILGQPVELPVGPVESACFWQTYQAKIKSVLYFEKVTIIKRNVLLFWDTETAMKSLSLKIVMRNAIISGSTFMGCFLWNPDQYFNKTWGMQILIGYLAWTDVNRSVFEQPWFFKGAMNLQCNPTGKEGRENCYFELHTDELHHIWDLIVPSPHYSCCTGKLHD